MLKIGRLLLGMCICFSSSLISQEAAGLVFGNYNGINSTKLNPSFSMRSAHKWDLQLAGAHAFFQTDYGYIHKSNLFRTLTNLDDLDILNYPDDPVATAPELSVIFKTKSSSSYVDARAEVFGPGFALNINENIRVGVFSRSRSFVSSTSIPEVFNYYILNNSVLGQEYTSSPFNGAYSAWNEVGINYAQKIDEKIIVGLSLKYNVGITGGYFNMAEPFSYVSNNLETLEPTSAGTLQFGYGDLDSDVINGKGFGLDIGITLNDFVTDDSYLGISVLDLGYTNFNGRDRLFRYTDSMIFYRQDYNTLTDLDDIIDLAEVDFQTLSMSNYFQLDHPTMLSVQYGQNISELFSIEAAINQRIPFQKEQLRRSNSIMATGIYETKNYSIFLPVTLYNYERIHPGLAARFYFITVGSDDLSSLFGKQDFHGADIYVNLNIYPFINRKAKKNDPEVDCFAF